MATPSDAITAMDGTEAVYLKQSFERMLVYAGDIIQQAKEPQSNQGMPRAAAAQHLSEEVEFFNRYCDQLVVSLESLKQRIPPSAAAASNHASATSQPPSDAMAVDAPNAKAILQKALLEN